MEGTDIMLTVSCPYYFEDQPTLEGVRRDISKIIGLPEIKLQLEAIVRKIDVVEKQRSCGLRIASPKPFHMVFVGNCGTGKSTVAKILAKLFYLAGALPSYNVTEMEGLAGKIKTAGGGILVVNVDRGGQYDLHTLEEILSTMEKGETSVIFAGSRKRLNRIVNLNKDLYKKFSVRLQFNDLSCQELATMLHEKTTDQEAESLMNVGYKLDSWCSVEMIGEIIAKETYETLRSKLNGHLVDQIIEHAKSSLESRVETNPGADDQSLIITLEDLENGVLKVTKRYKEDVIF